MKRIALLALLAAALAAQPATAREPVSAAQLDALAGKVPQRPWYPIGYYDIRIAAEGQMLEFPQPVREILKSLKTREPLDYDVVDCGAETVTFNYDENIARYGNVAMDVSRIRSELERMGFPLAAYRDPLDAYEKVKLAEAEKLSRSEVRINAGLDEPPDTSQEVSGSSSDEEWDGSEVKSAEQILAEAIEANRKRLAPGLPKVIAEGGCGAFGEPNWVIVRTVPPGGTVMLVNAFAFKVCTRKTPNPWDRFACRWNEIESGKRTDLSGRFIYQVSWPDGTVRRGTREIETFEESEQAQTLLFRKTGS